MKTMRTGIGVVLLLSMVSTGFGYEYETDAGHASAPIVSDANPEGTNFEKIDRRLGLDLRKTLIDFHTQENLNQVHEPTAVSRVAFTAIPVQVVSGDDVFIYAKVEDSTWWKKSSILALVYVKTGKQYELAYHYVGWAKGADAAFKTIDLDHDGRSELIAEYDMSGNQSTAVWVRIYRFQGAKAVEIFKQGLEEQYAFWPYTYANTYSFIPNAGQPGRLDIAFTVSTDVTPHSKADLPEALRQTVFPKPVKETIRFAYNNAQYRPLQPVYDFRKSIRLLLDSQEIRSYPAAKESAP